MGKRNLIVGLFVLASLGLFSVGLFMIGNRNEAFSRHVDYYAEFKDLSGLARGAKVQVSGMDAGQVVEIGIPRSPSSKFRVRIRVDERLSGLVRMDSIATIGTEGVVGDTFLLVASGSSRIQAAPPQSTLQSKEPIEIADLLEQAKGMVGDVDLTVRNGNGVLTSVGNNLNQTLSGAKTTLANVNEVVVGVKEGRGPAGMLLRDQAIAAQIRDTVANTQQATRNLNHVSAQADNMLSDVRSHAFPQKVDAVLASVQDTASNFDASSSQIRQTLADFTAPDTQGTTAGVNLRDSLMNVNAATGNMADDTEALKHNFFFKPFFRHRGYYKLDHISPDNYRNDRLFTSASNQRTWLSAEQLFVKDSKGTDQLTPSGKALIDSTVAGYGDAIVETPIVVEGYSDAADIADRLSVSRSRSIVVKNYLLNHFQLDTANVGSVAMENKPAGSVDHITWNGIR